MPGNYYDQYSAAAFSALLDADGTCADELFAVAGMAPVRKSEEDEE